MPTNYGNNNAKYQVCHCTIWVWLNLGSPKQGMPKTHPLVIKHGNRKSMKLSVNAGFNTGTSSTNGGFPIALFVHWSATHSQNCQSISGPNLGPLNQGIQGCGSGGTPSQVTYGDDFIPCWVPLKHEI